MKRPERLPHPQNMMGRNGGKRRQSEAEKTYFSETKRHFGMKGNDSIQKHFYHVNEIYCIKSTDHFSELLLKKGSHFNRNVPE